jgi:hypothetical protein
MLLLAFLAILYVWLQTSLFRLWQGPWRILAAAPLLLVVVCATFGPEAGWFQDPGYCLCWPLGLGAISIVVAMRGILEACSRDLEHAGHRNDKPWEGHAAPAPPRISPMPLPRSALLFRVDGSDLHDVAERIRRDLDQLVASTPWSRTTCVLDEIAPRDSTMQPDDLPDWELGVYHELPDDLEADHEWFAEVERIAVAVGRIAAATVRTFAVALANTENEVTEDITYLTGADMDLEKLRRALGVPSRSE